MDNGNIFPAESFCSIINLEHTFLNRGVSVIIDRNKARKRLCLSWFTERRGDHDERGHFS